MRGYPRRVHLRHIPREQNQLADWAARVARVVGTDVDLLALCEGGVQPYQGPPCTPEEGASVVGRTCGEQFAGYLGTGLESCVGTLGSEGVGTRDPPRERQRK